MQKAADNAAVTAAKEFARPGELRNAPAADGVEVMDRDPMG